MGGGVHEGEGEEVAHAEGFEEEDRVGEVGALDLGDGLRVEFALEGRFGVEVVGFAGARAAGAAGALGGVGLGDGRDLEGVHSHAGVVDFEFGEAGVDDVHDAVDGERGFGDVGRHDDFAHAGGGFVEDLGLEVGRHLAVDGEDKEFGWVVEKLQALVDELAGDLDIFLAGHEDEDVSGRLGNMDGQHLLDRAVHIVFAGRARVLDVDGKGTARNDKLRSSTVEAREAVGIHGGRGNDQFEVSSTREYFLDKAHEDVCIQSTLMGFIHDDARISV